MRCLRDINRVAALDLKRIKSGELTGPKWSITVAYDFVVFIATLTLSNCYSCMKVVWKQSYCIILLE